MLRKVGFHLSFISITNNYPTLFRFNQPCNQPRVLVALKTELHFTGCNCWRACPFSFINIITKRKYLWQAPICSWNWWVIANWMLQWIVKRFNLLSSNCQAYCRKKGVNIEKKNFSQVAPSRHTFFKKTQQLCWLFGSELVPTIMCRVTRVRAH